MIHPYIIQRSRAVPGASDRAGGAGSNPGLATSQPVELIEMEATMKRGFVEGQAPPAFQSLLDETEEEITLAPRTLLVIDGYNEALRVRVDGVVPLGSDDQFTVRPGAHLLEVDRLALNGSVAETRSGRVTFVEGTLSRVKFGDLAPVGAWSAQKKLGVAALAALLVGGAVYVAAAKR